MRDTSIAKNMDDSLIIEVQNPSRIQKLAWTDLDARPYNSPISHLVHAELASYYLGSVNYPDSFTSQELNDWMLLISSLNEEFYSLEKRINHPSSANPNQAVEDLKSEIKQWQDNIRQKLQTYSHRSVRLQYLLTQLLSKIESNTQIFLNKIPNQEIISTEEIRYLHAPHDLSFFTPSIGRLLSEQMHLILQTGLRGAYHLTPTPWYNIIQVHPSIQALSNAKKQVSLKSFALSGITHTSPFHAHDLQFFNHSTTSTSYKINKNNSFEAEKWVSLNENKPLDDIHYSAAFSLLIPRIIAILVFELPFLLIRLTVHCLNAISILLLFGYIPEIIIEFEKQLSAFHRDYSPFNALQQLENDWQATHWKDKVTPENLNILLATQNHLNVFANVGDTTQSHPYWKLINRFFQAWWTPEKQAISSSPSIQGIKEYCRIRRNLPIPKSPQEKILTHTAHNHLETAVDLIEEIAMVLDNQTIDALFRTNPGPALGFFNLSMFGFLSLLAPTVIPLHLKPLQETMFVILNKLCHQFMGHAVTENYANVQLSSFLFWQLSFYGTKLCIDITDPTHRNWYQEMAQYPDSFILVSMMLVSLGIMEAYLPSIPETFASISNPLAIFYNTINHEAYVCLHHGSAPANLTSLAIISVKSIGLYLNLLTGQEYTSEVLEFIHQFFLHPDFLIALHSHLHDPENSENHDIFIQQFCQKHQLPQLSTEQRQALSIHIGKQFDTRDSENHELLNILHALHQQDFILLHALHHKTFACEMMNHLDHLFDEYNAHHPLAKLDKAAFLNQFYSTYCQVRMINLLRLFEMTLFPLHLMCWVLGAACDSVLWTEYGKKATMEDLFIMAKLCYVLLHPLAQFIVIAYNYAFLNSLRIIPFVLRTSLECLFGREALEPYHFYQAFHHLDDFIQSFKIHYTVNQLLWPLQVLFANLSYHSGRFLDMSSLSGRLIEKILSEQNPVEIPDKNIYNRQSNEDNNNLSRSSKTC